jgi:hypothetical protein
MQHDRDNLCLRISGRVVKKANSSLNGLTIEFDEGLGLMVEARRSEAPIAVSLTDAAALPSVADAVCAVDWGWIVGSTVKQAALGNDRLDLYLEPAGPLCVRASMWQGSPFLAFKPYKQNVN